MSNITSVSDVNSCEQSVRFVADESQIERHLAEIWRRCFGPKGRDAGLHVLHIPIGLRRMVRFLAEVETNLGVQVPPTALLRLGTIPALAAAIREGAWPPASPLTLFRDGAPGDVLYVVSAGSGLVLELCDLALLINFPGQIWALQAPGLDGEAEPLSSIEDIARLYADCIDAHAPGGRCHMIGYSFGGLVMVEMARMLERSGHRLGLVGLLDSTCYERFWPRIEWMRVARRRIGRRISELRDMTPLQASRHLAGQGAAMLRLLRRRIVRHGGDGTQARSIYYIGGLEPDFQRVRDAAIVAFESHRPKPIDCKVVLFRSALGDHNACDALGIWRHLALDLEVVDVAGSHVTMIRRPLAEGLAREISQRLV